MAGIDSLVNSRADMFAANPQGLEQRYAMNQDLLDLLALQKLKKDKEAAQRSLQMQMQAPQGTVKDQLAGQVMDMTKQEVAASLAPGLQQMGQRMAAEQAQRAMSGGLPTQPAPNMVGMARGGIVGYAPGGDVELSEEELAALPTPYARRRARHAEEAGRNRAAMNLPSDMSRDELAAMQEVTNRYSRAAGPLGVFTPQTDEERGLAQQVMRELPDMSYADMLALLATGEIPTAAPRAESMYQGTDEDIAPIRKALPAISDAENEANVAMATGEGLPSMVRATATAAPSAGLPSLVPQRVIGDLENEANVAMATETLPAMQRAAPTDPRMSRYEDQLARLEAEEKDKLGSLIDFLLAAGASGGTNLGATLMGGGTGLQAREQRIKDEMARTIQNIETLQLEREKMTSEDERARLSRETQLAVARLQNQAQRPTDMQSRVAAYKAQIMAANPEMSEVQATAKAYEQIHAEDIEQATAASGLQQPNRVAQTMLDLEELVTKNVDAAIEAMPPDRKFTVPPEVRAAMETAERNRLMQAIYPVSQEASAAPAQGQRPPLESMFNQ